MSEVGMFRDKISLVMGIVLIVCGIVDLFIPSDQYYVVLIVTGVALAAVGIADIVRYAKYRARIKITVSAVVYAVLDIVVGILLILYPLHLALAIPGILAVLCAVFGLLEIYGAIKAKKNGGKWVSTLIVGIGVCVVALLFATQEALFTLLIAVYVMLRGVSLLVWGTSTGKFFHSENSR